VNQKTGKNEYSLQYKDSYKKCRLQNYFTEQSESSLAAVQLNFPSSTYLFFTATENDVQNCHLLSSSCRLDWLGIGSST
jgi:hypothetical protein